MARVTRSSKKAAAVAATAPEPDRNAFDVITGNSTPEVEEQDGTEQEEPATISRPKRAKRSTRKDKENPTVPETPAKTPSRRSKRGKKATAPQPEPVEEEESVFAIAPKVEEGAKTEDAQEPAVEEPAADEAAEDTPAPEDTAIPQEEHAAEANDEESTMPEPEPERVEGEAVTVHTGGLEEQASAAEVESAEADSDPHTDDEAKPRDERDEEEEAAISAELQLMADQMHAAAAPLVDEATIDHELEQMSVYANGVAKEAERPQTPGPREEAPKVAKTPKFNPAVHYDDLPDDDSFELHVSPRKSVAAQPVKGKAPPKVTARTARVTAKPKDEKSKAVEGAIPPQAKGLKAAKPRIAPATKTDLVQAKRAVSTSTQASTAISTVKPRAASSASQHSQGSKSSTVVIPHSKPRTIGLSFPPPPPPLKSAKPPTKSNFELPGEAFQRKIREQKEERRNRMEEEEQKRKELKTKPKSTFKAPTVQSPQKRHSLAMPRNITNKVPPSLTEKPSGVSAVGKNPNPVAEVKVKAPGATIRPPSKEEVDRAAQAQAVLKARKEAAERGRQTVKMWAEQQKQKEERAASTMQAQDAAVSAVVPP